MSHELRTPFNGVLGMLSLLERTALTARQKEYVGTAKGSADHLLSLLNDILDVSAMETGEMAIHPHAMDLHALVASVEHLMQPVAAQRGLSFHTLRCRLAAVGTGRQYAAQTDRSEPDHQRHQVQRERHSAAAAVAWRGSSRPCGVACRLPAAPAGQRRGHRHGRPHPVQTVQAFLTRGRQHIPSIWRHRTGAGDIAQPCAAHGWRDLGDQHARQRQHLYRVATAARRHKGRHRARAGHRAASALRPVDVQGLTVLVADDHLVNRKYMGALLEDMGHTVVFAENGEQACIAVQSHRPDLVLMDLHMPVLDGFDATRRIRESMGPKQLPIIALTADVFAQARDKAVGCGMNGFVSKPVNAATLQSTLMGFLGCVARPGCPLQTQWLRPAISTIRRHSRSRPQGDRQQRRQQWTHRHEITCHARASGSNLATSGRTSTWQWLETCALACPPKAIDHCCAAFL